MAYPQAAHIIARWSSASLSLNDADPVGDTGSEWVDSVNSISATQSTAASRPTYRTNVMGGQPAVRFDGSDDFLSILTPGALATAIASQTYSVVIVFQKIADAGGYGTLFSFDHDGGTKYYIADDGRLHCYPTSNGDIPYSANGELVVFGNTSGVGGVINNAGTERCFVNGTCFSAYLAKAPGTNPVNFTIGSSPTNAFPVNADIFEIIFYDIELTPPEFFDATAEAFSQLSQTTPWSTKDSLVVFDGDSLTAGTGASNGAGTYPYQTAQLLSLTYGQWTNCGIGYLTMSDLETKYSTDVSPYIASSGLPLKVIVFAWYNGRAAHPGPYNAAVSYLSSVRATNAYTAFGTSTDNSLTPDTDRADYDDACDANYQTITDTYFPIHDNASIGVEGAYSSYPAMFSDEVHLSDAGYAVLAGLAYTAAAAITIPSGSTAAILHSYRQRLA